MKNFKIIAMIITMTNHMIMIMMIVTIMMIVVMIHMITVMIMMATIIIMIIKNQLKQVLHQAVQAEAANI